jgi:hypothetical protein
LNATQRLLAYADLGAMLVLLAGLVASRLYRVGHVFTSYIATIAVTDALMLGWTDRFYTWEFWAFKQTLLGVLRFGSALELVAYTFQAFPGAKATARRTLLIGLAGILLALLAVPVSWTDLPSLAQDLQTRLANGTALLFAGIWGLVLWYNLPIHPFHRAILRGLLPYLLVFTVGVRLVATLGWHVRDEVNLADVVVWLVVVLHWAWVAWHPTSAAGSEEVVRALQPWRDRL